MPADTCQCVKEDDEILFSVSRSLLITRSAENARNSILGGARANRDGCQVTKKIQRYQECSTILKMFSDTKNVQRCKFGSTRCCFLCFLYVLLISLFIHSSNLTFFKTPLKAFLRLQLTKLN